MKDLIEALKILLKYGNPKYPTHCSHDELNIVGIEPEKISKEDVAEVILQSLLWKEAIGRNIDIVLLHPLTI